MVTSSFQITDDECCQMGNTPCTIQFKHRFGFNRTAIFGVASSIFYLECECVLLASLLGMITKAWATEYKETSVSSIYLVKVL